MGSNPTLSAMLCFQWVRSLLERFLKRDSATKIHHFICSLEWPAVPGLNARVSPEQTSW